MAEGAQQPERPRMTADDVGLARSVDEVAHVIQIALTPVFLLSGIASLLGVFSTRLARVADRVHAFTDRLEMVAPTQRVSLQRQLRHLRRRSHLLDAAVILSAVAGGATCLAALLLFVGTLRNQAVVTFLFAAFGFALLSTGGALALFLIEMLLASRGIRAQAEAAGGFAPDGDPGDAAAEAGPSG
jgi:hypothetical protein